MCAVRPFIFRVFVSVGLFCAGFASADWLPSERLTRLAIADPFEIRMMLLMQEGGIYNASLGATVPLLGLRTGGVQGGFGGPLSANRASNPSAQTGALGNAGTNSISAPFETQLGVEARGYFTLVQEDSRFPLKTVDGTIGGYFEIRYRSLQYLFRLTHISGHLADGSDMSTAGPFSRETASFRMGYAPDNNLHLYVGGGVVTHSVPYVDAKIVQAGGSYFWPDLQMFVPFIALDMQWRSEWSSAISSDFQMGLVLGRVENHTRSIRVYYNFYSGGDIRGQFFGQMGTTHSVGIEVPL